MVVDGRYELIAHLGGGGMGDVFKALDKLAAAQRDPDPYVAVKILKPAMQSNQKAVLALQREANRARRLTHPNILRVHQFEQDRETGQYFMVMEMLEGRSVESLMYESRNGQPWSLIAPLIGQICAGLTCAHEQGIIHSDIKPSNLFLTRRREVKILDFGIAAPVPSLTGHETLMDARKLGARTPAYASMETFMGMKPHYSDDVYSLACLTYEWLSARPPYARENEPYVPVPAPAALKLGLQPASIPSLTRAQNKALRKALALRRVERTQTIAEFWRSMNAAPLGLLRRYDVVVAAVAVAVLAALGVAVALLRPHGNPGVPEPTTSPVDQAVVLACHAPAVQETLESAISEGQRARDALEAHPVGSSQHGQERARSMTVLQCLAALERAGYSDARSAALLRELQALELR
jgi:serine/threonine protein kinase